MEPFFDLLEQVLGVSVEKCRKTVFLYFFYEKRAISQEKSPLLEVYFEALKPIGSLDVEH